jgi:ankyrin repeat protein
LTADRLAESIKKVLYYHIRLGAAHTILAQACLGVLLRLDNQVDRDTIKNFPLALYAARNWATHARVEDVSLRIKDGVECLFDAYRPHFAMWLWIHDEDERVESMLTMSPEKPEAVPLYYVALLGFRNLAEHLLAKHPEHVNARGRAQVTPMHAAVSAGHVDILSLLFEHGADLESRGRYDCTPLLQASKNGKINAEQCLLDCGANMDARDNIDFTPLFWVVCSGHVDSVRVLLQRGARTDDPHDSVFGRTVLHIRVRAGNIEVVRLLLEHGMDVNARDREGKTPSQFTEQREILELLSKHGAKSGE